MIVSLPVLLTSAVTNASLMDALGMTVEPLLFVLLLWYARRAPVLFGVTAALGFHVREFVAYGVAALLAVEVVAGELWSEEGRRRWLIAGITALGTTAALAGIARYESIRGPDTWIVQELEGNLATLGGAFCFVPQQAWRNVQELGRVLPRPAVGRGAGGGCRGCGAQPGAPGRTRRVAGTRGMAGRGVGGGPVAGP